MFWSDASDQEWGATVADHFMSDVWLEGEALLSINQRELLAVERGLCCWLQGCVVTVFCDSTTAVSYLRRQSGTLAPALNAVAQDSVLGGAGEHLLPQFVPGRNNVVADALSHPNQIVGSEFDWLRKRWPVTIDLFASSLSHRCSVYLAPVSDPMAVGTDTMLQSWDSLQGMRFLPLP